MNSRHVVVVGSANMDMVLRCPQLPRPGETVHGHGFQTLPGGKGANQAVAAARLGAAVSFVGCVGNDAFGVQLRRTLQDEGIATTHLESVAAPTGIAIVLVEDSGQNSIALDGGANAALTPAHVDAAANAIAGAAMLVCQLETPLPAVERAIAIARAAGVPVLLNPAPARPLPPELLRDIDVLVPNESEAAMLAGLPASEAVNAAQVAQRLHQLGARTVIVTLGERGAHVSDGTGSRHHDAQRVPNVVDTTGAGDTFIGAFAAARCAGVPLHEAVEYAQGAAALSVMRAGAMAAMPRRGECPLPSPAAHR